MLSPCPLSEPEVPEVLHAPAKEGRMPLANEQRMARAGHVAALSLPRHCHAPASLSCKPAVAPGRCREAHGGGARLMVVRRPPRLSMAEAHAKAVMFSCLDVLFAATCITGRGVRRWRCSRSRQVYATQEEVRGHACGWPWRRRQRRRAPRRCSLLRLPRARIEGEGIRITGCWTTYYPLLSNLV
jgi:hypothetical protein